MTTRCVNSGVRFQIDAKLLFDCPMTPPHGLAMDSALYCLESKPPNNDKKAEVFGACLINSQRTVGLLN